MTDGPTSSAERFADDAQRYRLDSRIATGGMGEVWRGTDTVLGREVAIKLLKPEYADDPTFRSRFETEARHAASLHHPNVAGVFDFGETSPTDGSGTPKPYLVMELVDGQPLSVLLRSGEPLDPVAVRELLAQAADAIGAAHAAGIVHRDVKPANLMVTPDRQVKITDFGIARAAEGLGLTETGQVMGTPQYLSPEQARGQAATPASDVYSLGVVAYECLVGQRPFQAETAIATALAHLNDPIPALPDSVPADLAAVVRHALEKSPADRFPDAAAFGAALRDPATAATAIVGTTDAGEETQVLRPTAPAAGAAGAGLAGAGMAGAGAAAAATHDPTPTPSEPLAPTPRSSSGGRGSGRLVLIGVVIVALIAAVVLIVVLGNSADETPPTDNPTKSRTKKAPKTSDTPSPSSSAPTEQSSSATPTPSDTPSSTPPTSATPSETPTPTTDPTSASATPTPSATTPAASAPATAASPSASPAKSGSPAPSDGASRSTTNDAETTSAEGRQR